MKWIFVILFCIPLLGVSQKKRFFNKLAEPDFPIYEVGTEPSVNELDLINFDTDEVCSNFLYAINTHLFRRHKIKLTQDSIYNKLCQASMETFSRSIFRSKQIWKRKTSYFYKAIIQLESNYRFYQSFAFNVPLVDHLFGQYYYDRHDEGSDLHLIYGSKKANKIKEEEGEPLKYIHPVSEQELVQKILRRLIFKFGKINFSSNYYTRIGFAIKVDARTLNKNRLPEAQVIVMIGGKLMQRLRV